MSSEENKNSITSYIQNGNLLIFRNRKELAEKYHQYMTETVATRIQSIGVVGNRQGLRERLEVFEEMVQTCPSGLSQDGIRAYFNNLCRRRGYSMEKRQELWEDYLAELQDFKNSLLVKKVSNIDESVTI